MLFQFLQSQRLHPRCQCRRFDAEQLGGAVFARDLAVCQSQGSEDVGTIACLSLSFGVGKDLRFFSGGLIGTVICCPVLVW